MKAAKTLPGLAFFLSSVLLVASPDSLTITTVAGNGKDGFNGDGGPAASAQLFNPHGIAVDASGNLYIADTDNNRVRKVSAEGTISTVAGNGIKGFSGDGGSATSAELRSPWGVALDSLGNLYIADWQNFRIRKVDASGIITTLAGKSTRGFSGDGGPATLAELSFPEGVVVDARGNLYIADLGNNRIRMVSTAGIITTVAGNGTKGFSGDGGPATAAALDGPVGVAVDSSGNIYIDDENNVRIRKVDAAGIITTVAGGGSNGRSEGGPATAAEISDPAGVAVDSAGSFYFSDANSEIIRKVSLGGIITTIAGSGDYGYNGDNIPALSAKLSTLGGIATDSKGDVFFVDEQNQRIRKVH